MIVKAKPEFNTLRNKVLGLDNKDYRALQTGDIVDIDEDVYKKFEKFFTIHKDVKDGNRRSSKVRD